MDGPIMIDDYEEEIARLRKMGWGNPDNFNRYGRLLYNRWFKHDGKKRIDYDREKFSPGDISDLILWLRSQMKETKSIYSSERDAGES